MMGVLFGHATSVPLWRRLLAGVGGLASAAVLFEWVTGSDRYKVLPPIVALGLAALTVHIPRLGPQVFARAAWWASLGLGLLIVFVDGGSERGRAIAYLVPSAVSLLVIGRGGIAEAEERSGHVASAFRSTLLLLMVLALADAQTFTVFGLISLGDNAFGEGAMLIAASAALIIGFLGLFRLALWGALVNLVACASVLLATLAGFFSDKRTTGTALLVLSGVHVLVATPVIVSALRGKTLPALPPRLRSIAMTVAIVGLVALAASRWALQW
jgi:hypothetical protein